ncbi:MAG: AAA family ATPase [Elusimicrobia bacterium]|nr:AAA family ATPase [Elusimicrobiota bacterium]
MAQYELSLYDYWRIIRRRKFIIFFTFTAVMISTWIFTNMQTQVFQATAVVKVEPTLIVPGITTEAAGWDTITAINTEVKIIKSTLVAERTARKLFLLTEKTLPEKKQQIVDSIQGKVDADKIADSNLIRITCNSSDPGETAKFANATAEVYIEKGVEDRSRRARELREFIEKQMNEAEAKLKESEDKVKHFSEKNRTSGAGNALSSKLIDLQTKKTDLLKNYTEQHPDVIEINRQIKIIGEQLQQLPKEELDYARLVRNLKLNEDLYTMLAKRFKESQISEADRDQSAFIVTPAVEPAAPIKPNRMTNFSVGTLIGLFLGFIFSLVIEHLDTSIGTIEDVETYMQIPVIGIIPHIESSFEKKFGLDFGMFKKERSIADLRAKMIAYHSSKSPFVESYHTLRTNIKFAKEGLVGLGSTILFTSAGIMEGKTQTAVNFALAAAQTGIKTLYMELDLRRPSVHKIFGIQRVPGFTDYVLGKKRLHEVIRGTTDFLLGELALEKLLHMPGLENFKILPCGTIHPNPVGLLNSHFVADIFEELKRQFELIIIDCPPVLLFADTLVISKYADSAVLVYRVGRIARGALKRAKDQLVTVKTKVIGVVLNDIKSSEMEPRHGYYYAYKYYSKEDKQPAK